MLSLAITILVLYLLYKLVFDFIVPVSKTTSQFKQHVNEMRRMQEEQMRRQREKQAAGRSKTSSKKSTTTTDGEYIDYEEVK